MNYTEHQKIFKALGDVNRLLIIELLKDGEKCACVLLETLKISQPTLSHHMRILTQSGLVDCRKDGKWMHYSISSSARSTLLKLVDSYFSFSADNKSSSDCCK